MISIHTLKLNTLQETLIYTFVDWIRLENSISSVSSQILSIPLQINWSLAQLSILIYIWFKWIFHPTCTCRPLVLLEATWLHFTWFQQTSRRIIVPPCKQSWLRKCWKFWFNSRKTVQIGLNIPVRLNEPNWRKKIQKIFQTRNDITWDQKNTQ